MRLRNGKEISDFQAKKLMFTTMIEIKEGFPWPKWLSRGVYKQMEELEAKYWYWSVYTSEMRKLLVGVFLDELKKQLENFGSETKKLNLYESVSGLDI